MRGMWSDMAGSTDWKWSRYRTHTATRVKIIILKKNKIRHCLTDEAG